MVFDGAKLPAKAATETDRLTYVIHSIYCYCCNHCLVFGLREYSKREENLLRGQVFMGENNRV
jgi:hypothetical protein